VVGVTLRCECGGAVRVQYGSDPAAERSAHWEAYECQTCGRTGTYEWNTTTGLETLTGCLTRSPSTLHAGSSVIQSSICWGGTTGFWSSQSCRYRRTTHKIQTIRNLERDNPRPPSGVELREYLREQYGEAISHSRLYQNLDRLAEHEFVEKDQLDDRTNTYATTALARELLEDRVERLALHFGVSEVDES
jgi:hypothetical protein